MSERIIFGLTHPWPADEAMCRYADETLAEFAPSRVPLGARVVAISSDHPCGVICHFSDGKSTIAITGYLAVEIAKRGKPKKGHGWMDMWIANL